MQMGYSLAGAIWAMTALSLGFVALRLYTRIRITRFVGVEDYLYICTGVLLVCFTAAIQVAVHYGLGQSFWILSLDDSSNAILWTYVANTFAVTGNATAKLSLGFFLLRVVQMRAQRAALWLLIFVTAATSIAMVIMLWNQTTPVKASWDPLRTQGTWNIQIKPMGVGLGAWSSACDFFFAIFPWLFIWALQMPRREKIVLAGGMSLGVLAGACGIVRTIVLAQVAVEDYTLNFMKYFAWAGAEIAVSMICLGLPTLRPLYLKSRGRTGYYETRRTPNPELPQYSMSRSRKGTPGVHPHRQEDRAKTPNFFRGSAATSETAVEMEPTARSIQPAPPTRPLAAHTRSHSDDADSSDSILGMSRQGRGGGRREGGNRATVDRERRLSKNWPLRG
ncbi:hypothetical protein C8A05DRAFT_39770 [Staphylotrichum tortipilum]|uniref:Rhodopsin domain-containing protein n=1 Tax=Staphylotrichum tortipilum TaxID=2831512 RepID=A0AAN6MB07_9PEZI|nr:hypothetical protein C8A05DRAFT_39770 [Staphylotrichum longicolle]